MLKCFLSRFQLNAKNIFVVSVEIVFLCKFQTTVRKQNSISWDTE